jgi:hypothetical protein
MAFGLQGSGNDSNDSSTVSELVRRKEMHKQLAKLE